MDSSAGQWDKRIAAAKAMLAAVDARSDISSIVTEDVRITFPKWGTCEGVADFPRYFTDLGSYIAWMRHETDSFEVYTGDDAVVIEGRSCGELVSGAKWPADQADGRFCTVFKFRGNLISEVRIHIDPDYVDATADHYIWRKKAEAVS